MAAKTAPAQKTQKRPPRRGIRSDLPLRRWTLPGTLKLEKQIREAVTFCEIHQFLLLFLAGENLRRVPDPKRLVQFALGGCLWRRSSKSRHRFRVLAKCDVLDGDASAACCYCFKSQRRQGAPIQPPGESRQRNHHSLPCLLNCFAGNKRGDLACRQSVLFLLPVRVGNFQPDAFAPLLAADPECQVRKRRRIEIDALFFGEREVEQMRPDPAEATGLPVIMHGQRAAAVIPFLKRDTRRRGRRGENAEVTTQPVNDSGVE